VPSCGRTTFVMQNSESTQQNSLRQLIKYLVIPLLASQICLQKQQIFIGRLLTDVVVGLVVQLYRDFAVILFCGVYEHICFCKVHVPCTSTLYHILFMMEKLQELLVETKVMIITHDASHVRWVCISKTSSTILVLLQDNA
jgi:hypothetical protein